MKKIRSKRKTREPGIDCKKKMCSRRKWLVVPFAAKRSSKMRA